MRSVSVMVPSNALLLVAVILNVNTDCPVGMVILAGRWRKNIQQKKPVFFIQINHVEMNQNMTGIILSPCFIN